MKNGTFSLCIAVLIGATLMGCGDGADSSDTNTPTPTVSDSGVPGATCVPNEQKDCMCKDGADGKQACAKDGKSFSECICVAKPDAGAAGDAPECVTDEDCAKHNGVCLVFWCGVGTCFADERDDDGDGHSLCAGGKPGSWDCDDNDSSVNPYATETCDGKDNDCDGNIDEDCASATFCEPLSTNPEEFGYRGCCGSFAHTNALVAGNLIKTDTKPAVYYYGSDGKRYLFPSSIELDSWYAPIDATYLPQHDYDAICNQVIELTDAELASIPIGGSVTKRPGAYITGILSDPKRYIVDTHHTLHWTPNDVLEQLYPGSVAERTHLTPDVFFVSYTIGSSVDSAIDYPLVAWVFKYQQADIEVELGIK